MKRTGPVLAGVLLAVLAACGSSGDRPSVDDISSALQSKDLGKALGSNGTINKAAADCFAKVVHDSRVSDRGLKAFLRGETTFSANDRNALAAVVPKLEKCRPLMTAGS
ncbi:MAG: hypothetical protein ACJ72E_03955 [Marmoricola sp.]